ncbi:lipid-binding SYLF domain-containing protein (plasmid) [Tistrella bauzanensis]|uniref:Lipid-binding SYLF domain-containing protein n=1 Tax=Tistrella arctica TaxID=3133430 RepID=A0ABU9YL76_9PROT
MRKLALMTATILAAGTLAGAPAFAAGTSGTPVGNQPDAAAMPTTRDPGNTTAERSEVNRTAVADEDPEDRAEDRAEAQELVSRATDVVQQMTQDGNVMTLLAKAKGVFIIPDYAEGALIAGARGGEGVFVARQGDEWSNPAFYDMGGISLGAQVGGQSGPVAFLLMNDEAVDRFKRGDSFSLNAEAGYTFADASDGARASTGERQVVIWSGVEGAFAGAAVSVGDISWDEEQTAAYYGDTIGTDATAGDIIEANPDSERGSELRQALSS